MNKKSFLLAAFTIVLWSSIFTGISIGLKGGYSSGHILLLRFLVASAVFAVYAVIHKSSFRFPDREDLPKIILLAFMGVTIYHFGITFGEQTVSAGTASMFIGSAPIFTALISIVFLKERFSKIGWLGLFIGFIGIFLITLGSSDTGGFDISPGALLILMSVIGTSFFFVLQKSLLKKYSAVEFTAYVTWIGTIPFLLFAPGFIDTVKVATPSAHLAVIYIGLFPSTIAYVTWAMALSNGKASSVSSLMYAEPVFAIVIAWLFLKELPSALSVIGGIIAISSIIIVNYLESKGSHKDKKELRED